MSEAREYPMPVFELTCLSCRALTEVVVDFGGPPRGTEFAVTCDFCGRTHWVTFAMGDLDPKTGIQNVVIDFSDSRNETTADALKDYLDLIDEVVERDVTDEVIETGLRELLQQAGRCVVRTRVDGELVQCPNEAVLEELFVDPGCPDDPDDGPHEMTLRYCEEHRHHAGGET